MQHVALCAWTAPLGQHTDCAVTEGTYKKGEKREENVSETSSRGSRDAKLHEHRHEAPTRAEQATSRDLRPRPHKTGSTQWQQEEGRPDELN